MAMVNTGAKAPRFILKDQNEKEINLEDYKGKKVLVYFYPKADTPGCTKQACSVRDAKGDKYDLGFTLLSDQDNKVAKAYGAWGEKSMYGKKYEGVIRSALLLDEEGKILQTWYKVSPKDTVPKVLEALEE
jgi:peroxiredoxin Q/BCP